MDDLKRQFGSNLRQLRLKLRFSQEELALACGLDRTYVGSVERGERNISLINIGKLAAALRVPPSDLLIPKCQITEGKANDASRPKKGSRKGHCSY